MKHAHARTVCTKVCMYGCMYLANPNPNPSFRCRYINHIVWDRQGSSGMGGRDSKYLVYWKKMDKMEIVERRKEKAESRKKKAESKARLGRVYVLNHESRNPIATSIRAHITGVIQLLLRLLLPPPAPAPFADI